MMTLLVDSGTLGQFVDSKPVDGLEDCLSNPAKLKQPLEIHTTRMMYSST